MHDKNLILTSRIIDALNSCLNVLILAGYCMVYCSSVADMELNILLCGCWDYSSTLLLCLIFIPSNLYALLFTKWNPPALLVAPTNPPTLLMAPSNPPALLMAPSNPSSLLVAPSNSPALLMAPSNSPALLFAEFKRVSIWKSNADPLFLHSF